MGCGGSKKSTEDEPSPKPNGKTPPPSKSPSKESAKDNKQLESVGNIKYLLICFLAFLSHCITSVCC